MGKFHRLETRRLLKELDYIKSDFDCKSEMVSDADIRFMFELDSFLERNAKLKEFFEKDLDKKIDEIFIDRSMDATESIFEEDSWMNIPETETDKKIKKIYREIAKKTHPDKVSDKRLNDFYIQAGYMYAEKDIAGIYHICDQLEIDYEFGEEETEIINYKIAVLKDRISFLESTFSWKWHNAENSNDKNQIILDYIKTKII